MNPFASPAREREPAIRKVAQRTLRHSTKRHMTFKDAIRKAMKELGIDLDLHEQYFVLTQYIPELLDQMAATITLALRDKFASHGEEERSFTAAFRTAARPYRIQENTQPKLYRDLYKKTFALAGELFPEERVVKFHRGPRYHLRKLRRDPTAPLFYPAMERLAA